MVLGFHKLGIMRVLLILASAAFAFASPSFAAEEAAEDDGYEVVDIIPLTPRELPYLVYFDEAGTEQALKQQGKLLLVHFWATWCAPCVEELPKLDALAAKYKDKGLSVLTVSLDGVKNADKVKAFYVKHNITQLGISFDNGMQLFRAMQARVLPTSFAVKDGYIVGVAGGVANWQGPETVKQLEALLQ